MMKRQSLQTSAAGLLGATAVALGAFGAHGLRPRLEEAGMMDAWETAVLYHLAHAVALLALALHSPKSSFRTAAGVAAAGWTGGTVLFSGSLYLLALGGPRFLGPVTPLGGLLLLGGWIAVVWSAYSSKANGTA